MNFKFGPMYWLNNEPTSIEELQDAKSVGLYRNWTYCRINTCGKIFPNKKAMKRHQIDEHGY